jgi:hypothetical protein
VFGEPPGYSRDSAVGGTAVELCRVHLVPFVDDGLSAGIRC